LIALAEGIDVFSNSDDRQTEGSGKFTVLRWRREAV
jgi:hypothetical protein